MKEIINRIESYGFECEAGLLENCKDWFDLRATLAESEKKREEAEEKIKRVRMANLQHQVVIENGHERIAELKALVAQLEEALNGIKEVTKEYAGNYLTPLGDIHNMAITALSAPSSASEVLKAAREFWSATKDLREGRCKCAEYDGSKEALYEAVRKYEEGEN